MFIPTPTFLSPTTSTTPSPLPTVPNYSLFLGLLALAGNTISQPPLILLFSTIRDSRLLRISPLFCAVDFLVSTYVFVYALTHGLNISDSARAVIVFRSVTDEEHFDGEQSMERAVEGVMKDSRIARVIVLFGALSQVIKFFGMHGVGLEKAAGIAYAVCAITTELLPILANWNEYTQDGGSPREWWKGDTLDPRVLRVSAALRRRSNDLEEWLFVLDVILLLLHTSPAMWWGLKWYYIKVDSLNKSMVWSTDGITAAIPESVGWFLFVWCFMPYLTWFVLFGFLWCVIQWDQNLRVCTIPDRFVDAMVQFLGLLVFDFEDYSWGDSSYVTSICRLAALVTAALLVWLPLGLLCVCVLSFFLVVSVVTMGPLIAVVAVCYKGLHRAMNKVLGRERVTPKIGRVMRSRRVFFVHTLTVGVLYYFGIYTGIGTWREPWTEKLG